MSATITQLRPAKRTRKPHRRKLASVIKQAHQEADEAGSTQDLSPFPLLRTLAWLANTAKPRARSVELLGVRFPLSHSLWNTVVICPRTRRRLVGTVTL